MKIKIRVLLVFFLILISAAGVYGQGEIIGLVSEDANDEGLPGANVQIEQTVLGASTNLEGAFIIRRVPVGSYTLRISMIGFRTVRVKVTVRADERALVKVRLTEAPVEIDPVVVTASKWHQEASTTPSTIEVLTAKEILARSPIRIEDALETAAGVQITQENVNIRGSDGWTFGVGSRVLVMLDGVPLTTSDLGSVNWFMVAPSDIERVEVVRGAGSAIYGSSAMGGVINFITRDPGPETETYARVTSEVYDKFRQFPKDWTDDILYSNRVDFRHSRQVGKLGIRLSGSGNSSKGYVQNSAIKLQTNISGKFVYHFDDGSKWSLFSNYMFDDREAFVIWKNQAEATRVAPDEIGKQQTRWGVMLSSNYTRPLSTRAAIEFRGYLNSFLLGTQAADLDFAPALGLGGTIQGNYLPWRTLSLIWGSDFKFDRVKSDIYGERKAVLAAPYLQTDWQFHPKLSLTLGGRYDRYDIAGTDTSSSQVFDRFTPRFGLNYRPFEGTTLKGNVANGFKFPVIFQLYFGGEELTNVTWVANPRLRSETSWSYEIGVKQEISPSWFVELTAFYTDIKDLIEPTADNVTARFTNAVEAEMPGIEFVSRASWWENRLGLRVNFIYMNPHDKQTKRLLRHRQKLNAFVGPSFRLGNFELQADYIYSSKQERYLIPPDDETGHQFVPKKVFAARLLYHKGPATFVVGSRNIFNYAYTLRDQYLEEPRKFFTTLTLEF